MKLVDLGFAPELILPAPTLLHRVQLTRSRRGAVAIGHVRVPPPALLVNRFDIADLPVAYFADAGETAVYEALARREVHFLMLREIERRSLLVFQTVRPKRLLDLRPHAGTFPVLQSLRFVETQEIAREAYEAGFEGIAYRSAQQYGADCFALIGKAVGSLRLVKKVPLFHPTTKTLHHSVAEAQRGSRIALLA